MSLDMGIDMCQNISVDMCLDMRIDMCLHMDVDMCFNFHIDECLNTRAPICARQTFVSVHVHTGVCRLGLACVLVPIECSMICSMECSMGLPACWFRYNV